MLLPQVGEVVLTGQGGQLAGRQLATGARLWDLPVGGQGGSVPVGGQGCSVWGDEGKVLIVPQLLDGHTPLTLLDFWPCE